MNWLRKHWRWTIINALATLLFLGMASSVATGDLSGRAIGGLIHSSGEWGNRFLLLSLAMTPLDILFGWNSALPLRKSTGLWAFVFATLHLIFFTIDEGGILSAWRETLADWSLILGLLPLLIMLPLALTSTDGLMHKLGKWWKPLHRTVYAAAVFTLLHVALLGHLPLPDMILLTVFLVVRIPPVRRALIERRHLRHKGQPAIAAA